MPGKLRTTFLASALLALAAATPAAAQNTSQYTSVAPKTCTKVNAVKVEEEEHGVTYACRGLPGYIVLIDEGDLRTTVSIGTSRKHASDQRAYEQGFSPFNAVHDNLEWRIDAKTKKPFATIQRWLLTDNDAVEKDIQPRSAGLLVVTRIPPGKACHVAYIDVRANENPNALAQKAADELAKDFDCDKDKTHIIGNKGRAVEISGIE
ncbi:MAG: hypothetical protein KF794_09580 [Xanthobacteraceae bacterium]|nr:hypothetical protein [Xanthobacteraceae bacterium]QYK44043.1 MAG: hypothetical protein KF794_09580 [Xanthobacteraceae bacterium]HMN51598.1 hypothetical protein [Xanthobacteraceae bacterium]